MITGYNKFFVFASGSLQNKSSVVFFACIFRVVNSSHFKCPSFLQINKMPQAKFVPCFILYQTIFYIFCNTVASCDIAMSGFPGCQFTNVGVNTIFKFQYSLSFLAFLHIPLCCKLCIFFTICLRSHFDRIVGWSEQS